MCASEWKFIGWLYPGYSGTHDQAKEAALKLHILSDLHLEFGPFQCVQTDADVVVLAGDIRPGSCAVKWAKKQFEQPVLFVPGNHEFYRGRMLQTLQWMAMSAAESNVHLLDRSCIVVDDIRFVGTTLWSDLSDQRIGGCQCGVLDNDDDNIIGYGNSNAQLLFERNRTWLKRQLAEPFTGKTVVITHHAPSASSIHPRFAGDAWNACFTSDMEDLMGDGVDLWIHGHTHNSFDYRIKGTRVVCNPRGYVVDDGWENRDFDPALVVEV